MVGVALHYSGSTITTASSLNLDKDCNSEDKKRRGQAQLDLRHSMREAADCNTLANIGNTVTGCQLDTHKRLDALGLQIDQHLSLLYPLLSADQPLTLLRCDILEADSAAPQAESDESLPKSRPTHELTLEMKLNGETAEHPVVFQVNLKASEAQDATMIWSGTSTLNLAEAVAEKLPKGALDLPETMDFFDPQSGVIAQQAHLPVLSQSNDSTTLITQGAVFYDEVPAPALSRQNPDDVESLVNLSHIRSMDFTYALNKPANCFPNLSMSESSKRAKLRDLRNVLPFLRLQAAYYGVSDLHWPTELKCSDKPNQALASFRANAQALARAAIRREFPTLNEGNIKVRLSAHVVRRQLRQADAIVGHKHSVACNLEFEKEGGKGVMLSRPLVSWRQEIRDGVLVESRAHLSKNIGDDPFAE